MRRWDRSRFQFFWPKGVQSTSIECIRHGTVLQILRALPLYIDKYWAKLNGKALPVSTDTSAHQHSCRHAHQKITGIVDRKWSSSTCTQCFTDTENLKYEINVFVFNRRVKCQRTGRHIFQVAAALLLTVSHVVVFSFDSKKIFWKQGLRGGEPYLL